jgi:[amino group carrier protein]-L-2-aminoadipate 6-kinase
MSINKNKRIVIKVGGTEGLDYTAICADITKIIEAGHSIVVVHGGSAETNQLGEMLNIPQRTIISPSGHTSRYTDIETLEVFIMAVNGKINTKLVQGLQKHGLNAFGLSGVDGRLILAERKKAIISIDNGKKRVIRDDMSGKITHIDQNLLSLLVEKNHIPVIAPLAISLDGEILNVDADRVAAHIAFSIQADLLILLTAVPGILQDFPNESSLIKTLKFNQLDNVISKVVQGRMKKKVLAAKEALSGGVKKIIITDGRSKSPITDALKGNGTWIG